MIEYTKAKTEDSEELIDFINMVFSHNERPHDFKRLLPKLYGEGRDTSDCHYIVKENGKIKAAVGVFPTNIHVGNTVLKVGQLGSVSVHPYARGKGYMKKLMAEAIRDSREKGFDALVLGGLKNRYQYFGFMPTETKVRYTFLPQNVEHLLKNTDSRCIAFQKISADSKYLGEMKALYESCPVYADRQDTQYFYDVLCSWEGNVYAVLKEGSFAGYLSVLQDNRYFTEYKLKDADDFPSVLKAWFLEKQPADLRLICGVYEREKCEIMGKYCESFQITTGHSWNIFHTEKFVQAWLEVKNSYESLEPGSLAVKIKKDGCMEEICKFHWNEKKADSEKVVEISRLEMMEAMFSEAVNFRSYGDCGTMKYKNWFPLPLFLSDPDAC